MQGRGGLLLGRRKEKKIQDSKEEKMVIFFLLKKLTQMIKGKLSEQLKTEQGSASSCGVRLV